MCCLRHATCYLLGRYLPTTFVYIYISQTAIYIYIYYIFAVDDGTLYIVHLYKLKWAQGASWDPELTQKHVDGLKNHRDSLEFDRMQQAASDTIFKFRDIAASWMLRLDGTHCDCAAVLSEIDCHLMWLTSVATHVFFDVDDAQNAVAAVSMKHDEMREKVMQMIDKSREDDEDQVLCGN